MAGQRVQTKREIAETLQNAGIRPRKRFGQHFLIDGNHMRRLVAGAEIHSHDVVFEVGGGTGGLTDLLAQAAARVICVEVDRAFHGILLERFRGHNGVTVVFGDVLESKHRLAPNVTELLAAAQSGAGGCLKLVANLPYQVATPLILNLLLDHPRVRRFCFTVQSEVGERILSPPDGKAYGPLSILAQLFCECQILARLGPEVFWPRPRVESVMIRMDVRAPRPFATRERQDRFVELLRKTFDHRRKTLRTALRYAVDEGRRDAICRGVDAARRPESFNVSEWLQIAEAADSVGPRGAVCSETE
jgi:16S rRNA (adenine1518-N6/adenine1519-N6)-dimethyltransferase